MSTENSPPRGLGAVSKLPTEVPLPPERFRPAVGAGEFTAVGEEFFAHFKNHAGLQPDERVLDVGCGIGRMAAPLLSYLDRGSYDGFDIVRPWIDWCRSHLAPLHPRFKFQHADIHNAHYNPNGTIRPWEYRFPYPAGQFDFVFLTSVFTHMFAAEVEQYLREIARVLRPGGRVLATFFILDEAALQAIPAGRTSIDFRQEFPAGRFAIPDDPEMAVAYYPEWVRSTVAAAGLRLRQPLLFGNWCERDQEHVSYQDLVIADRA